ncbi:RNA-directed DNA polymerase from mobile element jockey, partial [Gonioctena quinquepunctata]
AHPGQLPTNPNCPLRTPISEFDVEVAIHRGKNTAPGPDSINRKTMKRLPNTIYPILALLMNACLEFTYFPRSWKYANTVMIPKPGKDPTKLDSYRPISLINVPGKLFELILKLRIMEYFEINNILPPFQHGFRAEHSTQNALIGLTTDVEKNLNSGHCTVAIFLDIQKAFDKVWHDGLIKKLIELHLPEHFIRLLISYIRNRKTRVKIGTELSDPPITPQAGVPQGSILSPILFSLYVHDIPKTHEIIQYADDTVLYVSAPNTQTLNRRAQNMLGEFTNWCSMWRVQLNPNKTQTILFKHPNNSQKRTQKSDEINLTLLGKRLELQDEVCYLGVTFTRTLNWQTDLDKTLIKVRQRASILRSLGGHFGRCHPETLLHTYKTFIRPLLDYKANIYAVLPPRQQYAIQTTERRILRTCQYLPRLSLSNEVYNNVDFDPILTRFQKLRQGYVDRVIRGGNEAAKATLLSPWSPDRRGLRHKPKKKLPFLPSSRLLSTSDDLPDEYANHLEETPLVLR